MNELIPIHVFAEDYSALESWRLTHWCKTRGATDWTVTAIAVEGEETETFDRFNEVMAPYRLPDVMRRHLTAYQGEDFAKNTRLWKLTSASLAALKETLLDGIFTYDIEANSNGWFENLILYRQGELMLGVVSHEAEGVLRVTSEERQSLEREGFRFRARGTYVGY